MGIFGVLGWIYGAVKIPTIAGIAVTKKSWWRITR